MSRSNWRKALLINSGKADSGTQTAVTQGNNIAEIRKEVDYENQVANSHETQPTYQFRGAVVPDPRRTRQGLKNVVKDR